MTFLLMMSKVNTETSGLWLPSCHAKSRLPGGVSWFLEHTSPMVQCCAEPMPGHGPMALLVTGCSELRFLFVVRKAVWCMEDTPLPFLGALPEHACDRCVLPALGSFSELSGFS